MKRCLSLLMLLALLNFAYGQNGGQRPKIGLVLSGGGAKGFAHVGVLKVLEEAKIPIDCIAGTSIGSIVGALYACGYDAAALEKIVNSQDWASLLSNEYKPEFVSPFDKEEDSRYNVRFPFEEKKIVLSNGVLNGQNAMELFSYLTLGYHDVYDFSKLPIPFLCIATDLTTGQEVVLDKGYLPKAMRASMSIPAAFTSTEIDGKMLVDGGIVNNYPVDRCKEMGANLIIGVDIMDSLRNNEELNGIPEVISQLVTFMGMERSKTNTNKVDVYIRPYVKGYTAASFDALSAQALMQRGEDAARRVLPQLIRLRDSLNLQARPQMIHHLIRNDTTLVINQIEVTGTDRAKIAFYLGQIGIKHDQKVTLQHLRNGISRLYSTGNYDYVNYQLVGKKKSTLRIEVRERKNNKINAGLHYDSELRSAMLLNVTLRNQNFFGSRLSVDTRLSQFPMFAAKYAVDRGWKPGFFAKMMYMADRFYRYNDGKKTAEMDVSLWQLLVATHSYMTDATRLTLGANMDKFNMGNVIGDTTGYQITSKAYFSLFGKLEHNKLNKIYFPTRGTNIGGGAKLILNSGHSNPTLIGDFNFLRARSFSDRTTLLYTLNSRLVIGNNKPYFYRTFLGGVQQVDYMEDNIPFNGLRRMEICSGSIGAGRLEFRVKMWEKLYVSATGDFGMYSEDNTFLTNFKTIYGFGLNGAYDSVVGPLELNFSFSGYHGNILPFLSLGYWF